MPIRSSFLCVPLLIIVLPQTPTTFGCSLNEDRYLGLIIWDYQQKRPSCGQREGLNQSPKPLDHHALTKWTQKIKCSHSLYHYTYPVTSFLFGSQEKQLFFLDLRISFTPFTSFSFLQIMAPARRHLCMKHTMSQHINNLVEQPALVKMVRWSVIGRTSKMVTGSWYFLSFSALTRQIRTAGL